MNVFFRHNLQETWQVFINRMGMQIDRKRDDMLQSGNKYKNNSKLQENKVDLTERKLNRQLYFHRIVFMDEIILLLICFVYSYECPK